MWVRRAPRTRREILPEGEAVVVMESDHNAVVLNPLGAAVWDLCDGALSAGQIVDLLSERFGDQPRSVIERDVDGFLDRLIEVGLLEELPARCGPSSSEP